jgi:hypothetical protein
VTLIRANLPASYGKSFCVIKKTGEENLFSGVTHGDEKGEIKNGLRGEKKA